MQMPIDTFEQSVIVPALKLIDEDSPLLAGVLAALCQTPIRCSTEVSFGLYGMTHAQHWSIWDDYLVLTPLLASRIRGMASQHQFLLDPDQELNGNLSYATVMAAMWLKMHCTGDIHNLSATALIRLWVESSADRQAGNYRQLLDTYHRLTADKRENVA